MHGFRIDPWKREIEVVVAESWDAKRLVRWIAPPGHDEASGLDSVLLATDDRLWVDDLGYAVAGSPVYRLKWFPHPIFGRGLVLGLRWDGVSCSPVILRRDLESQISWTDMETTGLKAPDRETANGTFLGPAILRPSHRGRDREGDQP